MKLLLTSSGIANRTINDALVDLLGKPIAEADALFIPTAIYPFPGGGGHAWRAVVGETKSPLCNLGWRSLGLLELSVLPSIDRAAWVPTVEAADTVLVWGGDPVFLSHWLIESGVATLLPTLPDIVYVGVSAGSIATARTFAETYSHPPLHAAATISAEPIEFPTPQGLVQRTLVTAHGAGFVDFAVIPHYENADFPDATSANAALWASHIPAPTFAIDDQSAIRVVDGQITVVSEGRWQRFTP